MICQDCGCQDGLPQPAYFAAIREPDGSRADMDRWLDERQAASTRRDEEDLILGMGWSPSVCQTHEIEHGWASATASRWYQALPERWMRDIPKERQAAAHARRLARAAARGLPPEAAHGHPRIVPLARVQEKLAQREAARKIIDKIRQETETCG